MLKYFKNHKQKRIKLAIFKKEIVGIFNGWEINIYRAKKGDYNLWIGNGPAFFRDEGKMFFLGAFTKKERALLWDELMRFIDYGDSNLRGKINKEFNLSD